jgi:erythrocyte band 7 integral membrane protein
MSPTQPNAGPSMNLQPSYQHEIPVPPSSHYIYEGMIRCLGAVLGCIGSIPCFYCCNPFQTVDQGYVGMMTRFGKYYKTVDPGLHRINLFCEKM